MADLSLAFNPTDIASASDAASDAQSKIASVSDVASDALSRVEVVSDAASSALAAASDALSKATAGSTAASNALSKATVASQAAAAVSDAASNALSKATVASQAASDALSQAAAVSDVASNALSQASDALSKVSNALSKATAGSAAASNALSKASDASSAVAARSEIWDAKTVILKIYHEDSAISSGDGKMYFAVPDTLSGMNLVSCGGHLYTAATSGVVAVQFHNVDSAVDMLSAARPLEWDVTEKDTVTAAASSVVKINTSNDNVVTGEEIRVDIDEAGSGAKGLEVRLTFEKP